MRNQKGTSASSAGIGILWRDGFRMIKLCVMGISMVSVPWFVKPAFVGTYGFLSMAIPKVRETISVWLTPAFLYVILNCIILAIVANSGVGIFNPKSSHHPEEISSPNGSRKSHHVEDFNEEEKEEKPNSIVVENNKKSPCLEEQKSETTSIFPADAISAADTLDATWEAIIEAQRSPPTRQLRKADTWQTRRHNLESSALSSRFGKSETWKSGRNLDRKTLGAEMLRKEPSLGQDELNKRVEAFIAKVNHDMKLQREESLVNYKEMVNRGSG